MQKYQRILIKLSGEVLKGKQKRFIYDEKSVLAIAKEIAELSKNHQVVVFMGGGNIFRWRDNILSFLDQITGDWIGIKSTILNGLVLLGALKNKYHKNVKMFTDHDVEPVFYKYNINEAKNYLSRGNILIISSYGKPYQTTDTGAAQTAKEIGIDIILKGSKVDGVYSADPKKDKNSKFYSKLSYKQAIEEKLAVMDGKAFEICQKNKIPIIVFNLYKKGNIKKAIEGKIGSIIK